MGLESTDLVVNSDGTAKFSINIVGTTTMQTYFGNFKCKCSLNAIEYIKSNKEFIEEVGSSSNFGEPEEIAFALIQLKYRLLNWAPFWAIGDSVNINGGHLKDYNVITHVFNICMKAEEEYKDMMKKEYNKVKDKIAEQRDQIIKQRSEKDLEKKEETEKEEINLPE